MTEVVQKTASAYMSGPELYAVLAAGYAPISVVVGVSAFSMGTRGFGRSIRAIFVRGEMAAVWQTAAQAIESAHARAIEKGTALGADLVLVSEFLNRDLAELVEVTCYATAFKKVGALTPMPISNATS